MLDQIRCATALKSWLDAALGPPLTRSGLRGDACSFGLASRSLKSHGVCSQPLMIPRSSQIGHIQTISRESGSRLAQIQPGHGFRCGRRRQRTADRSSSAELQLVTKATIAPR